MIAPIAVFLGIPFPLGIMAANRHAPATIAWGWGMNGLLTVIGGMASVIMHLMLGLKVALMVGLCVYVVAGLLFWRLRASGERGIGFPVGEEAA